MSTGAGPLAADCLYILRAAVGTETCDPECICDVNAADGATASDALTCLRKAVGQQVELDCQCDVTTTTLPPGFGQVMNEACVVCHGSGRIADVSVAHPGLQTFEDVEATIDAVAIEVDDQAQTATLTVDFTVTDPDGDPIANLDAASATQPDRLAYLRLALSQLLPAEEGSGDPDKWVSYTIGERNPANLTDNGGGNYTYVFGTNLYDLYVPSLRHRLLLIVSGEVVEQSKNVTYDFIPEQLPGPFVFDLSRDIVSTSACNECHERLGTPLGTASFHGGSRYLTEGCATCHTDALGDGLLTFAPLVHKIHAAKVVSDDPEEPLDFSEVTYPQDLRNCAKCHAGVDGENWHTRPSREACGSCHDDVDFDTGENHPGGAQPANDMCAFCHSSGSIQEDHLTENATPHNPEVPEGLASFEYVIDEVTVNANDEPVVTFHILKDGAPLDLTTVPPAGFSGAPSFLVAYAQEQDGVAEPADYNQLGRSAGQPASVSLSTLAGSLTGTPESYTAVLTGAAFPAGATLRAVALQGYFTQLLGDPGSTDDDVGRHTPSVVAPVTGDAERREVVDSAKCLNCHEIIEAHGGNRVNNVAVCVTCHNPNLSSSGRATDATQTPQEQKDALAAAGYDPDDPLTWPEATQHFKNLIHGIHAAGVRNFDFDFVRNFRNGIYYDWSEVTFPGVVSNCETCHLPGTYDAELPDGVLVSTDVTSDGIATREGVIAARDSVPNPLDLILSPTAATCHMCHDSHPATAHVAHNGGVIDNWRAQALGD